MGWKKLLSLDNGFSSLRSPSGRVASTFALCVAFSLLAFYVLIPIYGTATPSFLPRFYSSNGETTTRENAASAGAKGLRGKGGTFIGGDVAEATTVQVVEQKWNATEIDKASKGEIWGTLDEIGAGEGSSDGTQQWNSTVGKTSTAEASGSLDKGEAFGEMGSGAEAVMDDRVNQDEILRRTHDKSGDLLIGEGAVVKPNVEDLQRNRTASASEGKNGSGEGNASSSEFISFGSSEKCDIFDGRWVWDDGRKPYYRPGSCPFVDVSFNCHRNGRRDYAYLKWRWQPHGCNIPRLNASDFLERLRGRRLIFVGDSLNRNMWESLVCILRQSLATKKNAFEIRGRRHFKTRGYYSFKFKDYDCFVDFVKAPFLVREVYVKESNGKMPERLRLDLLDGSSLAYRKADIIIFNSGHWWRHDKTARGINYFQEGNHVHQFLPPMEAYKKGMNTWARWIDKNIDRKKTQIFFRGLSCEHFRGGQWNSGGRCYNETKPIFDEAFVQKYTETYIPVMSTAESTLRRMQTPVSYLNISRLTNYRKDGHPSIYRMKYDNLEEVIKIQDCSHWCLPGIPDTWNELLYASLLKNGKGPWRT